MFHEHFAVKYMRLYILMSICSSLSKVTKDYISVSELDRKGNRIEQKSKPALVFFALVLFVLFYNLSQDNSFKEPYI